MTDINVGRKFGVVGIDKFRKMLSSQRLHTIGKQFIAIGIDISFYCANVNLEIRGDHVFCQEISIIPMYRSYLQCIPDFIHSNFVIQYVLTIQL